MRVRLFVDPFLHHSNNASCTYDLFVDEPLHADPSNSTILDLFMPLNKSRSYKYLFDVNYSFDREMYYYPVLLILLILDDCDGYDRHGNNRYELHIARAIHVRSVCCYL